MGSSNRDYDAGFGVLARHYRNCGDVLPRLPVDAISRNRPIRAGDESVASGAGS
jgi:hypothetical protein